MNADASQYPALLARAVAEDLVAHPTGGVLARVVVRWFDTPGYLTIHALGEAEEADVAADDAWHPLEWPNEETEIVRADRVLAEPAVQAAAVALEGELEEGVWSWEEQPPQLVEAGRLLRAALTERGVPLAGHFAVAVSHLEGWGAEESVPAANPPEALRALAARGVAP